LFSIKSERFGEQHRHAGQGEGASAAERPRHRREKMFDANDIRLLILHILSTGAAHGYELIKAIEALAKGEYVPSPGLIYPSLTLMEDFGLIIGVEEHNGKKCYSLTEAGQLSLNQQQPRLNEVTHRLASLAVLGGNRRRPDMQRAVQNFKMALNTRLSSEALPQETLYKIVDILDQAARDIERS